VKKVKGAKKGPVKANIRYPKANITANEREHQLQQMMQEQQKEEKQQLMHRQNQQVILTMQDQRVLMLHNLEAMIAQSKMMMQVKQLRHEQVLVQVLHAAMRVSNP